MLDDTIHNVAVEVRKWAEVVSSSVHIDNPQGWDSNLTNMCAMVSSVLAHRLHTLGFTSAKLADSGCHTFVLYEGYVLDLTATQFGDFDHIMVVPFKAAKNITVMWNEVKHLPKFELNPWGYDELELIDDSHEIRRLMQLHTKGVSL